MDLSSTPLLINDLTSSGTHRVRIQYRPGSLDLYFDDQRVLSGFSLDLAALGVLDPNGQAYVGFIARNGGQGEQHHVLSWSFTGTPLPFTIEASAPPSGSTHPDLDRDVIAGQDGQDAITGGPGVDHLFGSNLPGGDNP